MEVDGSIDGKGFALLSGAVLDLQPDESIRLQWDVLEKWGLNHGREGEIVMAFSPRDGCGAVR